MIQQILTYLVVAAAFSYAGYSFIKLFLPNKKNAKGGCSAGCAGCSMKSELSERKSSEFKTVQVRVFKKV